MRKLLVLATVALFIFGSCSNEDELTPTGTDKGDAIEFRTLIDKGTGTRAAVTNAENMLSFTVTGIWSGGTVANNNKYLFNALGITRGEDGNWGYTPKKHLPKEGNVDFYAYSPAASKNVKAGIQDYNPNNMIVYNVPPIGKTDAQEDFLVARRTGITSSTAGNTTKTVKLNFHHALSRIKFHAKKTKDDVTYVIGKIALVNLYETGKLNLSSDFITEDGQLNYASTEPKWETVGTKKVLAYVVDKGESPIYLQYSDKADEFYSLLGETNDILVLPQKTDLYTTSPTPPTTEFAIYIEYKAYKGSAYYAGNETTYAKVYFPVKALKIDPDNSSSVITSGIEFEMERQYNFYLTFGSEVGGKILFDADVSDWTAGN